MAGRTGPGSRQPHAAPRGQAEDHAPEADRATSGGVRGYENFLEAIFDPDHEEHDEMLEWIGGGFDPEEFDIVLANRELKGIK